MKQKLDKLLRAHPPIRFVMDVVDVYFSKCISRAAAELAYFLILTFFPIMICVSAFVNELHLDLTALVEHADPFLPQGVLLIFQEYLTYIDTNQSSAMLLSGAFLTILFASAAVRGLMNIMGELYGRTTFRGLWQLGASVLFSALLLAVIYLSLAVVVTGNWFFHLLEELLGHFPALDGVTLPWQWQWMRFVILFCLVLMFMMLIYKATAPRGRPKPPVLTGAFLASGALVGFSALFSYFISLSSRYSLVYGSLASVVILLVWLYLCGNILILGNVVNYVLFTHRRKARG